MVRYNRKGGSESSLVYVLGGRSGTSGVDRWLGIIGRVDLRLVTSIQWKGCIQ